MDIVGMWGGFRSSVMKALVILSIGTQGTYFPSRMSLLIFVSPINPRSGSSVVMAGVSLVCLNLESFALRIAASTSSLEDLR